MAEGEINIQAPIVVANDNPRGYTAEGDEIRGIDQIFPSINKMIEYHPNRMKKGVSYRVENYPTNGESSEYILNTEPLDLLDSNNESIITLENFRDYFDLANTVNSAKSRVIEYAPNGVGGAAPAYPYTPATESVAGWTPVRDPSLNQRWARFRDDDVDENGDGVYDNWTIPIPINQIFAPQDYVDIRFIRVSVSDVDHVGTATLVINKFYRIISGQILVNGDTDLDNLLGVNVDGDVELTAGRTFQYKAGVTYTFQSATANETIQTPPRTNAQGLPNNEPSGFSETIPSGTDQLFKISGQKSVYGQLKSDWVVEKVEENPNYIRYGAINAVHPGTIVNRNTAIVAGDANDLALISAGWNNAFNGEAFIATRRDDPGPNVYTDWLVEKIDQESGEFRDQVFKLLPFNLDLDSSLLNPPTNADASLDGFSDGPLTETSTEINYTSYSTKFADGTLKVAWSRLVPWTGKNVFIDTIDGTDNSFKTSEGSTSPSSITLTAKLSYGISPLWIDEDAQITYVWQKVFDNGSVVNVSPTTSDQDDFYTLGSFGTIGNEDHFRNLQRVVVKPGAVTGKAVFRCTQTLSIEGSDDIVFVEEFTINDITDGVDSKSYVVRAEKQIFLYDTTNTVFSPGTVRLSAYYSNLASPSFNWYRRDGSSWTLLTGSETGYTISGNELTVDLATSGLFASDSTAQEARFAVSTDGTSPDNFDNVTVFSDYVTVAKTSAAAVGVPGENATIAILSNENHVITIDNQTGNPLSGEIGALGKALTTLQVYDGDVKQVYGAGNDYTISVTVSGSVTASFAANGDDVDIYVDAFAQPFPGSASIIITITYGSITLRKIFSISTVNDPPGALQLVIDSNKGFSFTPNDRTPKTLTASLYDSNRDPQLQTSGYEYRWNINNVWTSWSATRTRTINRPDIFLVEDIFLESRVTGQTNAIRSAQVRINDIIDAKSFYLYADDATAPAKPASTVTPTGNTIWVPSATDAKWAVVGTEKSGVANEYDWSDVFQITGEGTAGTTGYFFHYMYIASSTAPSFGAGGDQSTLSEMTAVGWSSRVPATGVIWQTSRLWTGEGVVFDSSGNPNTDPVAGSSWNASIRLSGTDGTNATGNPGTNGWSPVFSIEVSGTFSKFLRLSDWIGGTGTKPGNVGDYVGASGFVSSIANAIDLGSASTIISNLTAEEFFSMSSTTRNLIDSLPVGSYLLITSTVQNASNYTSPVPGEYGITGLPANRWLHRGTKIRIVSTLTKSMTVDAYGPEYYAPSKHNVASGSQTDNATTTLTPTQTTLRSINVQNNSHRARTYTIYGEARFREDNGVEVVEFDLYRNGVRVDGEAASVDNGGNAKGRRITVSYEQDISPGLSVSFEIRAANVSGGNSLRSGGYLIAKGGPYT